MPEIQGYANKVAHVHSQQHPELNEIRELIQKLNDELLAHLVVEENDTLVFVKNISQAGNSNVAYTKEDSQRFASMLDNTEKQHYNFDTIFKEIRRLSNDFALPEDACTSYEVLFKMLQEFETDLQMHMHLKNNILFPRTRETEKSLLQ